MRRCSFCLTAPQETGRLVVGPGVFICESCVEQARSLLHKAPDAEHLNLPDLELDREHVLAHLAELRDGQSLFSEYLAEWVGRARGAGATWQQIGSSLGISRQSAWERFRAVSVG